MEATNTAEDKWRTFLGSHTSPGTRDYSPEKMSLQPRYLASLTAQLRTRPPSRFLRTRPGCGSLCIGASKSQIRWNSGRPISPGRGEPRKWVKYLAISAFIATGVTGWALARHGLRAESPELQTQYATILQMEKVSKHARDARPQEWHMTKKPKEKGCGLISGFTYISAVFLV